MGLFDFVTEAGSKLGGKIFDVTHDEVDLSAPQITPERLSELRTKSITENIEESGVIVQNLNVAVDGDKVTLEGKVNTQACSEKLTLVAGNQRGISSVDCQLEVNNPEPEATLYTVKSGDTLSKIAKEFYGDASKYPVIFEANQPMLTDPNKIFVGQSLRIPQQ
jgi:nucleoid-associated protein YgaU